MSISKNFRSIFQYTTYLKCYQSINYMQIFFTCATRVARISNGHAILLKQTNKKNQTKTKISPFMLNSRTKQWSARKDVSLTHAVLLISCRKTHQSQGQVTFLKTVPLFLQGYTYYLKRVMTPRLEPPSKVFLHSPLAWTHSPKSLTVDMCGAGPRTEPGGLPP